MAEERILETPTTHTTIIERRGGGIVLRIAVLIGGYYLLSRQGAQDSKDAAITSAAKNVGSAADEAGDAVEKSTQ